MKCTFGGTHGIVIGIRPCAFATTSTRSSQTTSSSSSMRLLNCIWRHPLSLIAKFCRSLFGCMSLCFVRIKYTPACAGHTFAISKAVWRFRPWRMTFLILGILGGRLRLSSPKFLSLLNTARNLPSSLISQLQSRKRLWRSYIISASPMTSISYRRLPSAFSASLRFFPGSSGIGSILLSRIPSVRRRWYSL